MEQRKLSIISIFTAIILIVFGFSLEFVTSYRVDAKEMDHSRQIIDRNYRHMNDEMNNIAKNFKVASFTKEKYYQDVLDGNKAYLLEFNGITERLLNLKSLSMTVIAQCDKMPQIDRDINNKCDVLKKNYELIVNTYISLIDVFNSEVELCNSWLIENQKTKKALPYLSTDFADYIDMDEDGQYNGKF